MTRLSITPSHCASCFNQDPEQRHIDFEAAYDGPVIPGTPEPIPVDDLVICERCLQEAFDLLDPQGMKDYISRLESYVDSLESEVRSKDIMVDGMRHATNEMVEFPVTKRGARPSMKGLDPKARDAVAATRSERRADLTQKQRKAQKRKNRSEAMKAYWARKREEEEQEKSPTAT